MTSRRIGGGWGAVLMASVLWSAACAHLAQPQTWSSDPRTLDLQQREYLMKDLVRGLPEETFRRWYTRGPGWTDPLRPSIQEVREEGGATVYEVGGAAGSAGEIVFRDGALDHWSRWRLMQESVVSAWSREDVTPPVVGAAALARIVTRDPAADPLLVDEIPDPSRVCAFGAGDRVETLAPLLFDREHGNRLERWFPPARAEERGGRYATLPAGTRLEVLRWDMVHGRRLRAADGTTYVIDAPTGLAAFHDVFCPEGGCVPAGAVATTARDLEILVPGEGSGAPLAVLQGLTRVPVWMDRGGTLPAGTQVTVRRWRACGAMDAEIEVHGAVARGDAAAPDGAGVTVPPVLQVPIAPPGLFVARSPAVPTGATPRP